MINKEENYPLTNRLYNLWNFYDNVEVGDSLSKPKGTSIMEVYRNGKVQKLDFNIEFKKTGERTSH